MPSVDESGQISNYFGEGRGEGIIVAGNLWLIKCGEIVVVLRDGQQT